MIVLLTNHKRRLYLVDYIKRGLKYLVLVELKLVNITVPWCYLMLLINHGVLSGEVKNINN